MGKFISMTMPGIGQVCRKCRGLNHFSKQCSSQQNVTQMVESGREEEECLFIQVEKRGRKLLAVLSLSGVKRLSVELTCQLDSAATCNVLSHRDYLQLGKPRLEHSGTTLTMYDGSVRRPMGKFALQLAAETISQLEFEVLDTKHHSLLSLDISLELGLLMSSTTRRRYALYTQIRISHVQEFARSTQIFSAAPGVCPGNMISNWTVQYHRCRRIYCPPGKSVPPDNKPWDIMSPPWLYCPPYPDNTL